MCAVDMKGLQPCGYGYKLLHAMFAGQEDRSEEIHVTDITGCLLRAWAGKKDPQPRYVHELLRLWIGIAIHKALEVYDINVVSEVNVSDGELMGRVDTMYLDNRIEDTKTTRWLNPDNLPYGNHAEQVQIYGTMAGGDRLQIQYIDLSGPTQCRDCKVSLVKVDGQTVCPSCGYANSRGHLGAIIKEIPVSDNKEEVRERVRVLREAMDNNTEPPAEESFLCNYCDYVKCEYNMRK